MLTMLCTCALTLTCNSAAVETSSIVTPAPIMRTAPLDVAALQACSDPRLGSLRAGRVAAPTPLGAAERAQLAAAQQGSTQLAALRAGSGPSNNEWTWLALGAGIVLLIFLI